MEAEHTLQEVGNGVRHHDPALCPKCRGLEEGEVLADLETVLRAFGWDARVSPPSEITKGDPKYPQEMWTIAIRGHTSQGERWAVIYPAHTTTIEARDTWPMLIHYLRTNITRAYAQAAGRQEAAS